MKRRKIIKMAAVGAAIVTAFLSLYSVSLTQYPISFSRMIEIIIEGIQGYEPIEYYEKIEHKIIWEMYIPRVIAGLIVGAVLGIAGAVMQSVIHNPLADPYTTGISSGAAFGVALFIVYGFSLIPGNDQWSIIVNAFVFAMIPCFAILLFASLGKSSSSMMILVGIAIMMVFSSATQLIMFAAESDSVSSIYEWNIGSLSLVNSQDLPYILVALIILGISMIFLGKYVTIMTSGDRMAQTIGVNAKHIRILCFFIVSACVALTVSFTGSIGFVGLVIPHLCRIMVGSTKNILALSAVLGALMLMGCDAIARMIILGGLPVGVITAAVGSPIFIYFLVRSKKGSYYG